MIWPYIPDTNTPYRDAKRHYDLATGGDRYQTQLIGFKRRSLVRITILSG